MHIISSLKDGGAQQDVVYLLTHPELFPQKDLILVILGEQTNSKFEKQLAINNCRVVFLERKSYKKKSLLLKIKATMIEQKKIIHILKEEKPDIVHTHITQILHRCLFPVIWTHIPLRFHTLHSDPNTYKGTELFLAKLAFHIGKFFPICLNEEQAAKAITRYKLKKYEIVKNGIDLTSIQALICSKQEAREKLGIPQNVFLIGTVGRLNRVKNLPYLIEIFEVLHMRHSNARLWIVGNGPEKPTICKLILKKKLNDVVTLYGYMDEPIDFYCAVDVFVLTSLHESCSLVTLEAQACGTPCVVSTGVPEDTVASSSTIRLSLDVPVEKWVNTISEANLQKKREISTMVNEFDINYQLKRLNHIYDSFSQKRMEKR
jgi:glycosyltransferase involved in cell wall biosynthesis